MKKTYTTGKLAKKVGVSERTVRYYDTTGLLKPSFIMENGYRCYDETDVVKLKKIIAFKYLGFPLQEIKALMQEEDTKQLQSTLDVQIQMLDKKIRHMITLKESLLSAKDMLKENVDWNQLTKIIQAQEEDEKILEHYRNANHLSIRIRLHELFSVNTNGWFSWIFEHIQFQAVNRLLEIGCGNGALWKESTLNLRNREIFLSDISPGMVETARGLLGEDYSYMVMDCQNISFKREYFDAVIANHTLFYVNDIQKGLEEISRVLRQGGSFYCTTYGTNHLCEINALVQAFDDKIILSDHALSRRFGIDNGKQWLQQYFKEIRYIPYVDALHVTQAEPLIAYIMSCHGNQTERLAHHMDAFRSFLEHKIKLQGSIYITKEAGLFICKK